MDPYKIAAEMQRAMEAGMTSAEVDQILGQLPPEVREQVRLAQTNARGGSALGDFARMGVQGLPFVGEFPDEREPRGPRAVQTEPVGTPGAEPMGVTRE